MLMVLASILVMTVFAAAALTLSTNRQSAAARDQNFQAAVQAAMSGVDDYVARLQANPNYFILGNTDASNPAFSGYTPVPGGNSSGSFTYSVTTSSTFTDGLIKISSTGKVGTTTRTVTATLRKTDFLDYMYYTQYETIDPIAYSASQASGMGPTTCAQYAYAGRPSPNGSHVWCQPIYFASADVLKGPVHSQDEIQMTGSPTFTDEFSTEWNDPSQVYYRCNGSCSPSFAASHPPTYSVIPFPSSNSALLPYADPAQGGKGCVFQGPTQITLNSNGTMTVLSPETPSTYNTGCGTQSWSTAKTVNVPNGQVVYVNSPTAACGSMPAGFPYPVSGDANTANDPTALQPQCSHGDAFVQGWLKGQLTIGAANNIYVTNSIRYVGSNSGALTTANLNTGIPTATSGASSIPPAADTTGNDVLGLAASNFVEVYHPLTSTNGNVSTSPYPLTNVEIDAAIVASNDSFLVQDWASGPTNLGALTLVGGIIQSFRGPVATTGGTGYDKNYNYDTRLKSLSPPHLADLASSVWNPVEIAEGHP